jgi:hypothetical protein
MIKQLAITDFYLRENLAFFMVIPESMGYHNVAVTIFQNSNPSQSLGF